MFAVVNVITRQDEGVTGGRVDLEAGGLGKRAASATLDLPMGQDGGVALSGIVETSDGRDLFFPEFNAPATNNGIAHHLDWERRGEAMLSARRGDFSLSSRFSTRRKATPTAPYGTIFNDRASRVRDDAFFAELKYETQLSDVRHLMIRSYYDDYAYHGAFPYPGDPGTERAANRILGVEAAFGWDLVASDRLTVGAEYRRNLKTEYVLPDTKTGPFSYSLSRAFSVTSLYLQNDLQLRHNLSLLAGIRRDENSISGSALTPRVALVFDPTAGTTLKAMHGLAFRAPSIYEAGSIAAGSPKLKPERLAMSELILIQRLRGGLLFTGSLYHYSVRDLIDVVTDTTTGSLAYRNLSRASANGLEASLDARFAAGLRAYLNYGYQRAVARDSAQVGVRLTNSPAHLAKLGVAAQVVPQASVALELRYESGRKTVQDLKTQQFVVANLSLLSHPFGAGPGWGGPLRDLELSLSVLNLLNARYSYPGGVEHLQSSIPQDGRTFLFRLGYAF
jgi:iron complex outermembrane receptor protein